MSAWDGLTKAAEEANFWTSVVSIVAAILGTLGAQKVSQRVRSWAATYEPRRTQQETDVLEALKGIERAVREQGHETRQQMTRESEVVQSQLRTVENGVSRILGGMTIGNNHRTGGK